MYVLCGELGMRPTIHVKANRSLIVGNVYKLIDKF